MKVWTKDSVELIGGQFIPERMSELELTMEDGLTQVWFVTADGRLTGGAEAANLAMRYVWWAWPFTFLYYLPGIQQLQDAIYRWVANNRHRMPGSTDACAIPNKSELD